MLGTLIESRAVTPRRTGGSIASILIHSAIITGGVIATAKDIVNAPPEPVPTRVATYVRQVNPTPVAPQPSARVSTASIAAPFVPRLNVPSIVPVGIPPVDLNATPTPADFKYGPVGRAGILCDGDCGQSPAMDGKGNQLWNTSELMMRLLEEPVPPHYPESLRRAGVEGDVTVKFVVDTTGRVDMRTIEVLRSTHSAFTTAVRETISRLRFAPATSGERKVPALAVMPFHFTLR
jgi:protein TonB